MYMIFLSKHLVGISWYPLLFLAAVCTNPFWHWSFGAKSNESNGSIFLKWEHKTPGFETDNLSPPGKQCKQNKKTTVVPPFYQQSLKNTSPHLPRRPNDANLLTEFGDIESSHDLDLPSSWTAMPRLGNPHAMSTDTLQAYSWRYSNPVQENFN